MRQVTACHILAVKIFLCNLIADKDFAFVMKIRKRTMLQPKGEKVKERGVCIHYLIAKHFLSDAHVAVACHISYYVVYITKILPHVVAEGHGSHAIPVAFPLKFAPKLNAINSVCIYLAFVPARRIAPIQVGGDATGNGHSHAKYVDEDEQPVL